MVQDLLELKGKVDSIIAESFQGRDSFSDVVRESFESVINRRQNKPAELIGTQHVHVQHTSETICILLSTVE